MTGGESEGGDFAAGAEGVEQGNGPRAAWADSKEPLVYVKKWVRTRHAILFRLSNHTVQVIFLDGTEVILSSEVRGCEGKGWGGKRRGAGGGVGRGGVVEEGVRV